MRRKTDKDILKENLFLMIFFIWFILLGILGIIIPHITQPVDYTSLQTKDVTVSVMKHHYGTKGSSYDYIRTTDGEKYNISGNYQRKQLEELLTEGKTITIKWYKNSPFWTFLAEEIYVDGERVVTYDNDLPVNWKIPLFFGMFSILIGICGLLLIRSFVARNRTKQEKRDKRIQRKYGNKAK